MRVLTLANGVVSTIDAAVLSIHAIGRSYGRVTNNDKEHGVKQTDRLLANAGIDGTDDELRPWVKIATRRRSTLWCVVLLLFSIGGDGIRLQRSLFRASRW